MTERQTGRLPGLAFLTTDTHRRALLIALLTFSVGLLLTLWVGHTRQQRILLQQQEETRAALTGYSNALTLALDDQLDLLNSLTALVQAQPSLSVLSYDLGAYIDHIHERYSGSRYMLLRPSGVVAITFPNDETGSILGLNARTAFGPEVGAALDQALQTGENTLSARYTLADGTPFVAGAAEIRQADGERWGAVLIMISVPDLLEEAGITAPGDLLTITLANRSTGEQIAGPPLPADTDLIRVPVHPPHMLTGLDWELVSPPHNNTGPSYLSSSFIINLMLGIAAALLSIVIYLLMSQRATLRKEVTDRINEVEQINTRLRADVDLREQMESALMESEARFRGAFDSARMGMALLSLTGRFMQVNQALCDLLEYSEQSLRRLALQDILHPDDQEAYTLLLDNLLKGHSEQTVFDQRCLNRSRLVTWVRLGFSLVRDANNAPLYFVVQFDDRSQQKEMEEALWEQILRNELILQTATDGFCVIDTQGQILECNSSFSRVTGYSQAELITMNLGDLEVDDPDLSMMGHLQKVLEQGSIRFGACCLRKDGQVAELAASFSLIDMGATRYIFLSAQDITDQKYAEDALRESERKARNIVVHSYDGIWLADETGRIVQWNHSAERITGLLQANVIGHYIWDVEQSMTPDDEPDTGNQLEDSLLRALESGTINNVTTSRRIKRADGTLCTVSTSLFPVETSKGYLIGSIFRDITAQREAERQLKESQQMMQLVLDNIPTRVFWKDRDLHYLGYNRNFALDAGFSEDNLGALIGQTDYDAGWVAQADRYRADDRTVIETGKSRYLIEEPQDRPDGSLGWLMTNKVPLRDQDGAIVGVLGTYEDVTERKLAQDRMQESEARYRALFENVPISLWEEDFSAVKQAVDDLTAQGITDLRAYAEANPDWLTDCVASIEVLDVNQHSLELYQTDDKADLLGRLARTITPSARQSVLEEIVALAGGAQRYRTEAQTVTKSGGPLDIIINLSLAPGHENTWARVLISISDVTELKQAEAAEHEQRTLAEALRDTAAALASSLDPEEVLGRILDNVGRVVPHDAANIGLLEGDFVRIHSLRGYEPEVAANLLQIQQPLAVGNYRHMLLTKEGYLIPNTDRMPEGEQWHGWGGTGWVKSYAAVPITAHEQVIGFLNLDSKTPNFFTETHLERLGAFADQVAVALENAQLYDEIRNYAGELETRVTRRTEELTHERAQLRAILDSMGEGVIYTQNTDALYVNQRLLEMTGYGAWEVLDHLDNVLAEALLYNENIPMEQIEGFKTTLLEKGIWQGDATVRCKDGSTFEASLTSTLVGEPEETPVAVVTLLRDVSQERALQKQKDRFIANASHELRTPLANMKMRLYLLRKQPDKTDEHMRVLDLVTGQMEDLVENLLDLSRFERGVILLTPERTILQTLVHNVVSMQQAIAGDRSLTLLHDLPAEPLHALVDAGRITQVLNNLVANALNYTPADGTVTVHLYQDREDAVITVQDTGIGIAPEALDQIFEPFYRINEQTAPGTGLGLSISREIVVLHGGEISVESTVDEGSTFTIRLPLNGATPGPDPA